MDGYLSNMYLENHAGVVINAVKCRSGHGHLVARLCQPLGPLEARRPGTGTTPRSVWEVAPCPGGYSDWAQREAGWKGRSQFFELGLTALVSAVLSTFETELKHFIPIFFFKIVFCSAFGRGLIQSWEHRHQKQNRMKPGICPNIVSCFPVSHTGVLPTPCWWEAFAEKNEDSS